MENSEPEATPKQEQEQDLIERHYPPTPARLLAESHGNVPDPWLPCSERACRLWSPCLAPAVDWQWDRQTPGFSDWGPLVYEERDPGPMKRQGLPP